MISWLLKRRYLKNFLDFRNDLKQLTAICNSAYHKHSWQKFFGDKWSIFSLIEFLHFIKRRYYVSIILIGTDYIRKLVSNIYTYFFLREKIWKIVGDYEQM